MSDRTSIPVSDLARSKRFYEDALPPLGYGLVMEVVGTAAGFGMAGKPGFWVSERGPETAAVHVAFGSPDRAAVNVSHAAGGRDNGGPGLRPEYHPSYYGAYIRVPDGHTTSNRSATARRPAPDRRSGTRHHQRRFRAGTSLTCVPAASGATDDARPRVAARNGPRCRTRW